MNDWDDPRIKNGMRAMLEMRRQKLAAGDVPIGWKVGFGSPAFLEKFKLNGALVGFLNRSAQIAPGGTANFAGWTKPIVEPEIALLIGKDVAPHCDRDTAAAAIGGIMPAFEIVDLHMPPEDPEAMLSCNVYQRHVVLGAPDRSRAGGRADGLTCRVFRRGREVATTTDPQATTGAWVPFVQHVATMLGAFGERLRAGEVIITGSVVPPIAVERDDDEVIFELAPVGSVSVRLTH